MQIEKKDLMIMDDAFPSEKSGFRYIEFTILLEYFKSSIVVTTGTSIKAIDNKSVLDVLEEYSKNYPKLDGRILYNEKENYFNSSKLLYLIFLNNVFTFLPKIEESQIPFVFTLYPGGGDFK